ncbi:DUF4259 domain-containing protein [Streptomyces sp. CBMA29]|uniref:DUF4259 domain-containing protein n=1 Tax=Streptomyces sp. CBMA29 TaxID=1896314 RepID=UPI0016620D25|nr:DUF4259 domain-containing protein [Streptomyces sp. CBMA29]MBD0738526.1 hypothetical protein [Streptomyces sp. CBMA29]
MGTWDVGPFDNDSAWDLSDALDEAAPDARPGVVRDTLTRVIDTTGDLNADISEEAVAAAALVAAQCPGGEPIDPDYGPKQPLTDLTPLRALALQALARVLAAPSELVDVWDEPPGDGPWQATITRLQHTLMPEAPKAPKASE